MFFDWTPFDRIEEKFFLEIKEQLVWMHMGIEQGGRNDLCVHIKHFEIWHWNKGKLFKFGMDGC